MNNQRRGIIAAVAGGVLVILSFAWSYLVPTQVFWSENDQRVYDDAGERAHQATHRLERAEQARSNDLAAARAELETANEQFGAEQARFAAAETRLAWMPRIVLVLGLVVLLAGLAWLAR